MKEAYKNMRNFWLDVKSFEGEKGITPFGNQEIFSAGVEFCMPDHNNVMKSIIIAANSRGDASMYFENNSPSGLGGFMGQGHPAIKAASAEVIKQADKMLPQMQKAAQMPFSENCKVSLFAVARKSVFYAQFEEKEVRNPEHPFYNFFASTQLLISAFRAQEEAAVKAKN